MPPVVSPQPAMVPARVTSRNVPNRWIVGFLYIVAPWWVSPDSPLGGSRPPSAVNPAGASTNRSSETFAAGHGSSSQDPGHTGAHRQMDSQQGDISKGLTTYSMDPATGWRQIPVYGWERNVACPDMGVTHPPHSRMGAVRQIPHCAVSNLLQDGLQGPLHPPGPQV